MQNLKCTTSLDEDVELEPLENINIQIYDQWNNEPKNGRS